jgi:hypothetical protein
MSARFRGYALSRAHVPVHTVDTKSGADMSKSREPWRARGGYMSRSCWCHSDSDSLRAAACEQKREMRH